ncbi:MAG: UDP-3-O-(3-hydroxymyristoyl)glucosamine N-acyltransferase, partial [Planctomycetota bacterium]
GEDCLLVAQTGISGSAKVGDRVTLGGQVGVAGHITIGEGVTAGAQSGLTRPVPPNEVVAGTPARPRSQVLRVWAAEQRLPEILDRLASLESRRAPPRGAAGRKPSASRRPR